MNRLFLIIAVLYSGLLSTQEMDSVFVVYADSVQSKIEAKSLFVQDYIDTLISMKKEDVGFYNGIINKIKGSYSKSQGELDKALGYYKSSVEQLSGCCPKQAETVKAMMGLNRVYLNMGLYNFDTSYFNKGIELVHEALKLSNNNNDSTLIALCYNALGDYNYYSAFRIENMDSALHYYSQMRVITETLNEDAYRIADSYLGLANVYRTLGLDDEEKMFFDKSFSLADSLDLFDVVYALLNDKAEKYDKLGDFKTALALKKKAYDYVKKTGDKEFINRADRQLYYTYKQLGDYEAALSYYERYHDTIEAMHKADALKLQNELEVKQQINSRELKISQLENKQYKNQIRFLILIALFVGLILIILAWSNKSLLKANRRLEQKNKEILLARLKGQNSERKRMAGELHDNLNTKIAAVMWQLEALKSNLNEDNSLFLDKSILQLKDTYEDVRLISHNLMPEAVESLGFIKAITDLLKKLNESDKTHFKLITELPPDESFGDIAYSIYNIVFEMINNILKHSEAQNAWISISKDSKGDLDITVGDDGKGFEVDQMSNGYGIKNITSRVDNLNGHWNIESEIGKGTQIYISIPNI